MAKYKINPGYDDVRTVEAQTYQVVDDFIHFLDHRGDLVLTVRAAHVFVIERE
ncbi:hypothetical protein GCM10018790_01720 [Kitasatospora xanthocidica]|uniref:hypothetical protein n=1 Tax=Kitasatospora xanthocidica TaxID=83382 RepID=UPI001676FF10|nr:hypothetical protein [Kitasatospora xanthocidica]GHF27984.1 hypothetical protein GCM10018790_01720 [Kitasatospora xanthocidica]